MNKKIKSLVLAAVMGLSLTTVAVVPTTVEAASAGAAETLIGGAVAYAYVSTAFNKMDNSKEGQEESLARAKKQTGYLEDSAAQARVQRIMKTLEASPSVKRSYVVYANPSDDFNAFATVGRVMSVNKGALDLLDDDELAYVMAHEISHGEHKDIVNGLKKQVGLSTAVSLAAGGGGNAAILSNIAGNYMENQVFTMGQEKAADELGFKILSESPYNVGGAAASMAVLRNKYGDLYREGLNQVFSPNNHPKTSSRVKDNIDRMYTYSGNHVTVDNGAVFVNGVNIYSPANSGRYTGEERAYFMAGKLARLYHNGQIQQGSASYNGPTVTVAGQNIVTTPNADVALMVATNLNNSFVKAAGPAKGKQAAKTNKKKASKK
ncbi:MAG: M48 family metallopeptidase [Veillonella sp.]|uniref:M48 family metallopeptidase n=1 Tax=Veillonella sp. TaxID=1926307 RepID=UPI00290B79E5|nr:M48 family metallopeptidase [Veillonella sp.]MDU7714810.1 M48 family metallopeptidase [Veillonella sp.]